MLEHLPNCSSHANVTVETQYFILLEYWANESYHKPADPICPHLTLKIKVFNDYSTTVLKFKQSVYSLGRKPIPTVSFQTLCTKMKDSDPATFVVLHYS